MISKPIRVISNLLNFNKPHFTYFHYAHIIIENKAYFLCSWKLKNAYVFRLDGLKFTSYKTEASTYILMPKKIEVLDVTISNLWLSNKMTIKVFPTLIPGQIDFSPQKKFKEITARSVYSPQLRYKLKEPCLKEQITGVKITGIKLNTAKLNYI